MTLSSWNQAGVLVPSGVGICHNKKPNETLELSPASFELVRCFCWHRYHVESSLWVCVCKWKSLYLALEGTVVRSVRHVSTQQLWPVLFGHLSSDGQDSWSIDGPIKIVIIAASVNLPTASVSSWTLRNQLFRLLEDMNIKSNLTALNWEEARHSSSDETWTVCVWFLLWNHNQLSLFFVKVGSFVFFCLNFKFYFF